MEARQRKDQSAVEARVTEAARGLDGLAAKMDREHAEYEARLHRQWAEYQDMYTASFSSIKRSIESARSRRTAADRRAVADFESQMRELAGRAEAQLAALCQSSAHLRTFFAAAGRPPTSQDV